MQEKIYNHELYRLFPARTVAINESIKAKYLKLCELYPIDTNKINNNDLEFVYTQQDIESQILSKLKEKHKQGWYQQIHDFKKWWNGMYACYNYSQ